MPRTKQHIDRERSQRLYEALPGDKTVRYGNLKNWQESLLESNIILLVEQAMERMLEQEQFSVGWDER